MCVEHHAGVCHGTKQLLLVARYVQKSYHPMKKRCLAIFLGADEHTQCIGSNGPAITGHKFSLIAAQLFQAARFAVELGTAVWQ